MTPTPRLRILVVTQYFWPESFRINELVSELVKRGNQVTVLTGRPNYPDGIVFPDFKASPDNYSNYSGADVVRLPLRPRGRGSLRLVLNYWSFVFWGVLLGPWLLRGRKYDSIFIFQTAPITSAIPAILLKWIKKAPLTIWVLDLWPDQLSSLGVVRSKKILWLVGQMVRFIYSQCDLILTQSRAFSSQIVRWTHDSAKIKYFPQWTESEYQRDSVAVEVADEVRSFGNTFNVMFAGNIGDSQDFPAIIDAAERLKHRDEIRWLIVGDGRFADFVKQEIVRRNLNHCVIMLGRHPSEKMPSFFAGASVLLVSLRKEPVFTMTIPGKIQSYLTAGRPIVAMLDGEGARVIQEANAGLTCPAGDSIALAQCVDELYAMTVEDREIFSKNGKKYAKLHFDRQKLIDQLCEWLPRKA